MALEHWRTSYHWFRWSPSAEWEVVLVHSNDEGQVEGITTFIGKFYPAKELDKITTIELRVNPIELVVQE